MTLDIGKLYEPKAIAPNAPIVGKIRTREAGGFSARLRIPLGLLTSRVVVSVAKLAEKYGRGELFLTTRLGLEIPGVKEESFPALRKELALAGVELAGCGPRMRSTTACKGTVCRHGNIDTFGLAHQVDAAFNDPAPLPHKFKVGVGGCASSCAKPQLNDVGLVGVRKPKLAKKKCVGCGLCVAACHVGAVTLADKLPVFDPEKCVECGDCVRACPKEALACGPGGIDLYAGGRWGRERQIGVRIAKFLTEAEAVETVGRIKEWYALYGKKKERLGQSILRVGVRKFQRHALAPLPKSRWVKIDEAAEEAFKPLKA